MAKYKSKAANSDSVIQPVNCGTCDSRVARYMAHGTDAFHKNYETAVCDFASGIYEIIWTVLTIKF